MTPSLPPELQREIVEFAVRLNHHDANLKLSLSLVAQHIRVWVDRVFYEVVTIHGLGNATKFLKLVGLKSRGFFATAVKTLLLSSLPVDSAVSVLGVCTGVQSLAFWTWNVPTVALFLVSQLSLRQLSVRFCLTDMITASPPPIWLSRITHLDIAFFRASKADVQELRLFPALTHVALYSAGSSHAKVVCAGCPNLQVLLILSDSGTTRAKTADACAFDPRIVVAPLPENPIKDWEDAHWGLPDMWTSAELVVAERKAFAALEPMGKAA